MICDILWFGVSGFKVYSNWLSRQIRGVRLWIFIWSNADLLRSICASDYLHVVLCHLPFLAPYSQAPRGPSLGSCAGWLGKGSGDPKQKSWVQEGSEFAAGLSGCCRVCALRSRVKWAWWAKSCGGQLRQMMLDMGYAEDAAHSALQRCGSVDEAIDLIASEDAQDPRVEVAPQWRHRHGMAIENQSFNCCADGWPAVETFRMP